MSFSLTPSKRPFDRSPLESNGKGKWQKSAGSYPQLQPLKISPGSTVFRVLCPVPKSGSVIGKGGSVVSQIRQDTGAKVRVEEPIPGDDERVIVIVGPDKGVEVSKEQGKEDEDNNGAVGTDVKEPDEKKEEKEEKEEKEVKEAKEENEEKAETEVKEENEDKEEKEEKEEKEGKEEKNENEEKKENEEKEDKEEKESALVEDTQTEKGTSAVQKALLLVFERMIEGEAGNDEGGEDGKKSSIVVRLLVLSSQVGCLLGKGGSVIKQMAAESGAQIRILPRDKLPLCASAFDELVQLTGGLDAVRKALQSVSQQLLENPPRDRDTFPANKHTGPSNSFGSPIPKPDVRPPPSNYHFSGQGAPYASGHHDRADYQLNVPPAVSKYREHPTPNRMEPLQDITFRLLCFNENVGGVIGKGGTIIRTLQHETGCDIKILDSIPDSEDRIILVSGPAHPDDRISAAQDAVLRVQSRIVRAVPDNGEKVVARLLVSSNQIGCIIGRGGSIIADMRKFTGAHIRIIPRDQIPKCASENEEVVQMSGEFESVREALLQITARLQQHFFRDTYPTINHPAHPPFPEHVPPIPSFMGRRERSPPGMYSNLGPSFHKFDAGGGLPPHGHFHPHDDRSAFAHNIHRPGMPHLGSGRRPSSSPWEHQGMRDGPLGVPDYAGGHPQRRIGGFGSGSQPGIITSTTVEVSVPRAVVPSIYGENGDSLKKIRQISGANIVITEPRPGATETAIIISGTPEQTHAAQSLLQAFVMSGSSTP